MVLYSQKDKKWCNTKLGKSDYSIGEFGCAITSLANIYNMKNKGNPITPAELNKKLIAQKGYVDGSVIWEVARTILNFNSIEPFCNLDTYLDFVNYDYIIRFNNGKVNHFTNVLCGSISGEVLIYDVYYDEFRFLPKSRINRIIRIKVL